MMCLGAVLFGSNLLGTLCASWTWMSISFTKLGKFSFIIFSNKVSTSCYSSSPSGTPMIQMLVCLKLSQRFLSLSFFFFFFEFFSSCCSNAFSFLVFQIVDLILSFIFSTIGYLQMFISLNATSISVSAFFMALKYPMSS